MMYEAHPIEFVLDRINKPSHVYCFSRYKYEADSPLDERSTFYVKGSKISKKWLNEISLSLGEGEELALHSNIRLENGRTFHIPMIDFSTEKMQAQMINRITRFMPKNCPARSLVLYKTSRSYHAYSNNLLTPIQWRDFLGRLLLVNQAGLPDVVDSRWIGHRLMGGFSSLRWTANSILHQDSPSNLGPLVFYKQGD